MPSPTTLYLTALVPSNDITTFQCWGLKPGFNLSAETGTLSAPSLMLSNLGNGASYIDTPPHYVHGLHNAPYLQYVFVLTGLAYLTLPNATGSLSLHGGSSDNVLFAADVAGLSAYGHNTSYPSSEVTRLLEIPTAGGVIPNHEVLHEGPCKPGMNDVTEFSRRVSLLDVQD